MIRELKYVFYIAIIFFFVFFVIRYYFSEEYVKKSYRSLNLLDEKINIFTNNITILENDTSDIIRYVENDNNEKKKKYHFWNLLKWLIEEDALLQDLKEPR